jgi:hypothetical protein
VTLIRVVIGALIVAIVGVALVPLLVLLDLAGGGDGYGLCPDGIASCHTSYFDGPELVAGLLVVIFLLLFLLRIALHAHRIIDRHKERELRDPSMSGRDRLSGG